MKTIKFAAKSKRKGITPVIAIVLLLMMTVAAAGMAYVWIMSLQENIASDTEKDLETLQETKNARLSIESVWNDTNGFGIMIKNAGTYTFTATDATNIRTQVGTYTASGCATIAGPGTTCTITVTQAQQQFPITPGSDGEVTIKVISPKGLGDTYSCSVTNVGSHKSC